MEAQLDLLRTTGDQFTDEVRRSNRLPLPGIYMAGDAAKPALYDARIIPTIPAMIAPDSHVSRALSEIRPGLSTTDNASETISAWLAGDGITLGFSGYGTGGGYGYGAEYDSIDEIFTHCAATGLSIDGIVDGATGYGVPGLSGLLAQKHRLTTMGFAPLRSLRGAATRDTFTVVGEEFGDEAPALGATPDVLIALGGGPNAEKEVNAALSLGSLVILAAVKAYPDSSVVYLPERSAEARAAQAAERLVVCTSIDGIKSVLDAVRQDPSLAQGNREARGAHLNRVLATRPA